MSNELNLDLPAGLGEILKQLSLVIAKGVAPDLGDVVQKLLPITMVAAAQTLVAASGSVLPQCSLSPPPADIFISIDARTRTLRLECKHSPAHCWSMNGTPGTC